MSQWLRLCAQYSNITQHFQGRYGYEINGEVDADATFVDIDCILDAGSDIIREIASSPSPPPRATPLLPSVDVSKTQGNIL